MSRGLTPDEMVSVLKKLSKESEWKKDLRRTYAPVAKLAARLSKAEMRSGRGQQLARAARGIRANPTSTAAKLSITTSPVPTSTGPARLTRAAVFGTKGRTGWFASGRYAKSRKSNNPRWVGDSWTVATRGQGPRGINDALADGQPKIVDEFTKSAQATIKRAFPRSVF